MYLPEWLICQLGHWKHETLSHQSNGLIHKFEDLYLWDLSYDRQGNWSKETWAILVLLLQFGAYVSIATAIAINASNMSKIQSISCFINVAYSTTLLPNIKSFSRAIMTCNQTRMQKGNKWIIKINLPCVMSWRLVCREPEITHGLPNNCETMS
jgi:hypothetical protein